MTAAPTARDLGAGAGIANEQANADLSGGLRDFAETMRHIEYRADERQVMIADSEAKKLLSGKLLEYRQRQGINADGVTKEAETWLSEVEPKITETLTNPRQREAFNRRWTQLKTSAVVQASEHEAIEGRKATVDAAKASIAGSVEWAAANPRDVDVRQASYLQIRENAATMARAAGLDKTGAAVEELKYLSIYHDKVASALLVKSPTEAAEYVKAHSMEMNADTRERLGQVVKVASAIEKAQGFGDEVEAAGMTEADAIKKARERFSGDDEVRAVAEVKTRFAEKAVAINRVQTEAADEAYGIYSKTNNPNSIPAAVVARMDPKAWLSLQKMHSESLYTATARATANEQRALAGDQRKMLAEDRAIKRSQDKAFNAIHEQAMTDPLAFVRRDLRTDFPDLAPEQREHLAKLKKAMNGPEPAKLNAMTTIQMIDSTADALKYKDEDKAAFRVAAGTAMYAEQVRLGRDLSQDEMTKVLDRMTIQTRREGLIWDTTAPMFELTPQQRAAATVSGVPMAQAEVIIRQLQARGLKADADAVKRVYDARPKTVTTAPNQLPANTMPAAGAEATPSYVAP